MEKDRLVENIRLIDIGDGKKYKRMRYWIKKENKIQELSEEEADTAYEVHGYLPPWFVVKTEEGSIATHREALEEKQDNFLIAAILAFMFGIDLNGFLN